MHRIVLAAALAAALFTNAPFLGVLSPLWNQATTEEGCGMDPFGHCTAEPSPETEAGCGWDPFGRCLPKAQPATDIGCGFDPFGCPQGT